jgi:outer membrane murein-binding lipoprotein Lpp
MSKYLSIYTDELNKCAGLSGILATLLKGTVAKTLLTKVPTLASNVPTLASKVPTLASNVPTLASKVPLIIKK